MNSRLLSRSAIVSKNANLLVLALKNENDLVWLEKLCALSDVLSDTQRCSVLEDKLKKYTDARICALTDIKKHTDLLIKFQKQYKTPLAPPQYELVLSNHIECLLHHNVFPTEAKTQQKIWDQINTERVGGSQHENTCAQNAVNKIAWDPLLLQQIARHAIKGYYIYTFNELFTKPVSETFFTRNFHSIDWEANTSNDKFSKKCLWMDAISVLPLNLLTQLLDQHPSIAQDPLFVDKAALHPLHFKELLHLGHSKGMSLELVHSRLEDTFFVEYQNSRQKGVDFLEEITTQKQKDVLLSNIQNQPVCSSKRRM